MRGQSTRGSLPDHTCFLEVSKPNVIVSILKETEYGNRIIIRCYETDGKDTTVTIQCPAGIRNAAKMNIIEEELNNDLLPIENNKVKDVHIGKFAIETLPLSYK